MKPDWEPTSDALLRDQRAAYDDMRERCPVAYSELMQWSLFRHADITRVLHDPETFSNAVSKRISVPHGIDPPEHTAYRRIIGTHYPTMSLVVVADLLEPRALVEIEATAVVPA